MSFAIHTPGMPSARAAVSALVEGSGYSYVTAGLSPPEKERRWRDLEDGQRCRGWRFRDYLRHCLVLQGHDAASIPSSTLELIRAAVSTGEFTNIFGTSVNLMVTNTYAEAPDSTIGLAREIEVTNFQQGTIARITKGTGLSLLARGDTAKHATISDVGETYRVHRFAEKFVIDEQDIIDDRMDALRDIPREMGMKAARLRADLLYYLMLSNPTMTDTYNLFSTEHGNYSTGNALAAATLEAAIAAMGKVTENGAGLNLRAAHLVVAPDTKFTALTLLTSAQRIIASASGGTYNPLRNESIEIHSDGRMGTSGVIDPATGESAAGTATNWAIFADPTMAPVLAICYLEGTGKAPVVRSYPLREGQWGIGFDIKLDIGAAVIGFHGGHWATGV